MRKTSDTRPDLLCIGCGLTPEEIGYGGFKEEDQTDSDYVWQEEGTLNRKNGHFLCDGCYIKADMPVAPGGWVAP